MPGNTYATVYVGNLDERVDERVLYEIMVQAGPLVEVYIPRDKDSKRHKGYGFSEYKTEESAQYALRLFSGLVSLYNRSIRFSISGGERPVQPGQDNISSNGSSLRSSETNICLAQIYSPNHSPHPNYSPAAYAGMQMPGFLSTVAQSNAQLAALGQFGLQGRHHSHQYAYAPQSY